jgi:hypothetical protein
MVGTLNMKNSRRNPKKDLTEKSGRKKKTHTHQLNNGRKYILSLSLSLSLFLFSLAR